ncbi:MAG: asparagine synthetase B family protein [Paracoccaceae bacterium]
MFQGIEKLSPGSELIWSKNTVETHQWWDVGSLNKVSDRSSLDDSISLIGASLKTSVERHMIADVPIGSYLSGGIDSNVITALMANASNKKINTFTMGFEGYPNDDMKLAKLSSLALNTDHHEIFCTSADMGLLPDIAYSLDEPIGDPIVVPLTKLSAEASEYVKVVLSGEGADEVLGGYMFYKKINLIQNLKKIFPSVCFMTLAKLIDYFPPMLLDRFFDYPGMLGKEGRKKLSALVRSIPNSNIQQIFLRSIALNDREEFGKMMSSKNIFNNITLDQIEDSNLKGLSPIRALTKIQMHSWLPDDILLMADKLSMKNSLELRSPYLDIDVLNACSEIPDKYKIRKGITKFVLREFGKTLLPAEIINAPKRPFYLPLEAYYKQKELKELFRWALDEDRVKKRGLFSNEWIKDQKNKTDQGGFLPLKKLFSIVMLEVWMEKFSCDVL